MATKLNTLRQEALDADVEVTALKAEGRKLNALKERTSDQNARLDEIDIKLDALAEQAAERAKAIAREERYAAESITADTIEVGASREAQKPVTLGELMQGAAYAMNPTKARAANYTMPVHVQAELQAASGASSGVAADGGFLVRNEWNTSLLDKAQGASQLLSKCDQLPIGDGFDGIEAPFVNETSRATGSRWGGVQVYRAAEAATVTATKPGVGKFELRLEDMFGLFYATDRVLRDATLLEALASKAFTSEFGFKLDDEIVRGTGTGQCLGILNSDSRVQQAKQVGQTADTVKAENVINMFARNSSPNAQWYVNLETLPQLMTMSVAVGTAGGQLVYMPPGGLSSSPYGTLLGRPVNVIEHAAGLGDEGDIMLLDLSKYLVISKPMTSASSIHVKFINNETTFRWVWPIIGKPTIAAATTVYKATTATTVSPFVTLQAR